jgi:hypothetical protein
MTEMDDHAKGWRMEGPKVVSVASFTPAADAKEIERLKAENMRLRKALNGAVVDYDSVPYQLGDERLDTIQVYGTPTYKLRAVDVDAVANQKLWEENE